jgi:ABC-2 type transport system permease protein
VTTWQATLLVVERELREATRRKTFWIILGIAVLASTAAVALPEVLGGGRDTVTVGLVDGTDELSAALQATGVALEADVHIEILDSEAAARQAVDDGDVNIAVVGGATPSVVARAGQDVPLVATAQQVLAQQQLIERLASAGLEPAEVNEILTQPPVRVDQRQVDSESRRGSAAIIAVVIYLLLLMLTIQVANGTAIEKANRISEVLLAIVRPGALLFGKVIGVGTLGFVTLLAGAAPVLIKLVGGGDLPTGLPNALVAGAAWYVLGVALFLTMAGALGALVERQEEASSAVAPLTMLILAAYIVGQSASDTPVGRVLSIFPLTSTMVMPSRIAIGAASTVDILVSLVLLVGSVAIAVRIGSGIYRRAIVRTGKRLKVRDVLRST